MLKREELKIGQEYRDTTSGDDDRISSIIIKYIGNHAAFYEAYTDGVFEHESESSIESILRHYEPMPKPKKQIKLVGYVTDTGIFIEYDMGRAIEFSSNAFDSMRKVSERTIEVEE